MTNSVAQAHARNQERWRESQRNRTETDGWDAEPPANYDDNPAEMSDSQLVDQHNNLLQMQQDADYQNNSTVAKDIARRRSELCTEARERGIFNQLD